MSFPRILMHKLTRSTRYNREKAHKTVFTVMHTFSIDDQAKQEKFTIKSYGVLFERIRTRII